MKPLPFLSIALLLATGAQAEPYCADLLEAERLPAKYARNAPIYSDAASGWVFTQDQLKERYAMKPAAQALVAEIVREFDKRDVALAIVVPPPRPIIAGQAHFDAAMGEAHHDLDAAQASFGDLITGLAATGAIVPNLQELALSDADLRAAFYFKRDTHWTTTGALASARAVAQATATARSDLFPDMPADAPAMAPLETTIEEKGSLARILRDVCDIEPGRETAPLYNYARASAAGLLADVTDAPRVALLGSSFSDRYQTDHYRFADALSQAFDLDVENFSVSGGGPIGALEGYILSGALDRRDHPMVIWELPYTENFNSVSFLRQLLGALKYRSSGTGDTHAVRDAGAPLEIEVAQSGLSGIGIETGSLEHQNIRVDVEFVDGSAQRVTLRRRPAVPVDLRGTHLFGVLGPFGDRTPKTVTATPLKGTEMITIQLF
ncbi:hypothetical protein Dshi_1904 [Dinoroseobacter shibae DFL 12 = DSM 16493]|jgi:hypothetical protein|uniref:AlgX/AlgJ SGNH hydrolase-like domain-containing protein n=1 Tax=Dinoroseobacter shibae (strain DSM 16493 / NCIMB 14021 / DFL 12) TaxID=398580 RepID=A8LND3_DINSH|nr:hypothetical protein [Dinoroseobacter shibae]ABV93646.1 hypothetical protein Dshi_1904 [Dinoroseobacter shibae DFL 12 = DSM 16493]URF45096.1 hypothetical protein M8008_09850 [Dinoroseobacter shibae]URF49401.1 hypothetical protein M8007_09850 [Dinoroseobacter shibae]